MLISFPFPFVCHSSDTYSPSSMWTCPELDAISALEDHFKSVMLIKLIIYNFYY